MYKLFFPIHNSSDPEYPLIVKLFKEVLGYNDDEIDAFTKSMFMRDVAVNLTLEQAKSITEIFVDNRIQIYLKNQRDGKTIYWTRDLGIELSKNPPKNHYCDEPLISREHLVNPFVERQPERGDFTPVSQPKKPVVQCPYCKSENTKKITVTSKAVHTAIFGLFSLSRNAKQWKCSDCGSEF